jgi:selenide,water dikinase
VTPTAPIHTDIVLVGGGHAHVDVLKKFGMRPLAGVRLTLISPDSRTPYSGMLPGYLAGHYNLDEAYIDLRPLCRFAGARFIRAAATGIDLARGEVDCADRPPVPFDHLSLDIGSTPNQSGIAGAEQAVPVKPVDRFLERWQDVEAQIKTAGGSFHLAVIGAGAGGTEACLALAHRARKMLSAEGLATENFSVSLLSDTVDPLPSHNGGTRRRMRRALERLGIAYLGANAVREIGAGHVGLADGKQLETDATVLITPGAAAPWLKETGLALDDAGFVRVRPTLQSVTDDRVFATGDIAAFEARPLPKSGVYAVRQGPALAENLRRAVRGRALRPYKPQKNTMALISMGVKRAVLSWGPLAAEGNRLWRFKDWIDRRWMLKYQDLPEMETEAQVHPDIDPMRCGGCGAKVPADILHEVLEQLPPAKADPAILIGLDAPDDAAVLLPPAGKLLVQTVDQFRAFIDDPWMFGRIAANHCLGDIYAMGAKPQSALAAVTLALGTDAKMAGDLDQIMRGAKATLDDADVALIGGHTAEGQELALGLTVNGFADPDQMLRKGGLNLGDAIILTKALGTGVILAADMRQQAPGALVDTAIAGMLQSNGTAAQILLDHGATAATDVTGFGLIGHLGEMAEASGVSVELLSRDVPVLDGIAALFANGIASSLQTGNRRSARKLLGGNVDDLAIAPLFDPQTAGGLLAGVPADKAADCVAALVADGFEAAAVIGNAIARDAGGPIVLHG